MSSDGEQSYGENKARGETDRDEAKESFVEQAPEWQKKNMSDLGGKSILGKINSF